MSATETYLIAKYIPDLRRMEPRNIGVILWASGRAYCRFLPHRDAREMVRDPHVYQRWVGFWEKQVRDGAVALPGKKPVPVDSPEYLEALKETQKENFALDDGGEMISEVPHRKGEAVVDFLFQQLVATKPLRGRAHEHEENLKAGASRLLEEAGITRLAGFHGAHEWECTYDGVIQPLRFHYYIGNNGRPEAVLQRVKIQQEQSVNSTAWMFDRLRSVCQDAKRGSIVNTADEELSDRKTSAFLGLLARLSTVVIDLADERAALESAKGFACGPSEVTSR